MSKARIKELETNILKARNDYYNNQSIVSDQIYDAWIDELAELDPKNLAVIGIGAEPVSSWEKYKHKAPMGSLNKCQTQEEFETWYGKYCKGEDIFATLKLDGLSISLIYENGKLSKAVTRGSGTVGEIITSNVARMQNIPLKLSQKINATIRGEILLSKINLKKYFAEYSNARNAASGISRRYDGEGADKLSVLVYQIITDDIETTTQKDQFQLLEKLGFKTPPYKVLKNPTQVLNYKTEYQNSLRDKYDFDLDGLVFYNNSLDKQEEFGETDNRKKAVIAYKFDAVYREGHIENIICQVGNSGRITPVAVFNPKINLMGADVEKATLHNFSNIEDLGIGIGAKVLVCRSNDVIPFVKEVIKSPTKTFKAPTHCPECSSSLIEKGEYVQCPNTIDCPAQVLGRLINWIKELNILEWGDKVLQRLVETGKVETIADLYKLTVKDLSQIERMGEKSAQKCYDILWQTKEISLDLFLGAISIPMIGSSTIRLIMDAGYDTLEKIENLKINELEKISGIGPAKAKSLVDGLKLNHNLIKDILNSGIKIKQKVVGKLTGKSFCFTGSMERPRATLEKLVVDSGGIIKSSVGRGLSYLVIADAQNSTSSKAIKARELGTILISEEDFINMV